MGEKGSVRASGRAKRFHPIPLRFEGIGDMRSRQARRLKGIYAELALEFGSENPAALRELALQRVGLERAQADVVAGKRVAREDAVRISNCIARIQRDLRAGAVRRTEEAAPSLSEYMSARYGAG